MNIPTLDDLTKMTKEIIEHFNSKIEQLNLKRHDDEWLTLEEVKERYKVKSTTTIMEHLTPRQPFGKNLFLKSEVEEYVQKSQKQRMQQ